MAQLLIDLGTKGTDTLLAAASAALEKALKKAPASSAIAFPETNYYFPYINALFNVEVKTLADCQAVLAQAKALSSQIPAASGLHVDGLGGMFNKGLATLAAEEILAALAVAEGSHPAKGSGFLPDKLLRSLGIQLVDGRIAGVAVILGPAKDAEAAAILVRNFQMSNIVCLLAGNLNGLPLEKQLKEKGVETGLENYVVSLGEDHLSAIYAVNWAIRASLIYGNCKSGQWKEVLDYTRQRVPAFVVLLSHVDDVLVATGFGALALGFPIISDLDVPQVGKVETTLYEALVTEKDYKKIASQAILTRGIKVKLAKVPVPVAYAPAFEGERVRKEQLQVEFGGKGGLSFEYLLSCGLEDIEDGSVKIVGTEIDQLPADVRSLPLGIVVQVAGRKMQKDFEPILERQIHRFVNYAQGIMHIGQRDINWIRISKEAFAKGFRLKDIGVILHAMLHQEFSAIVDKVAVTLYTGKADVEKLLQQARKAYDERDERLAGMTDESVNVFYSCTLCQSFAPNHVCIIAPERLGLCGAYSWLDGKASFEINPTGPNQPVDKGNCLDAKLGQWQKINEYVFNTSNKAVEKVSMYSLMDSPQTSCGCFECIIAVIPEVNGVMIVNRDFPGMTPSGMTFTTLAGSVGGGVQTPGFLGIGKLYVVSPKFIAAEGGLKRLVWMPKELKELLADRLKKRCSEIGEPGLFDKIADETVAVTAEELAAYLQKVNHPVLNMDPLF